MLQVRVLSRATGESYGTLKTCSTRRELYLMGGVETSSMYISQIKKIFITVHEFYFTPTDFNIELINRSAFCSQINSSWNYIN